MAHDVTCSHCGAQLLSNDDQPCPFCGKKGCHIKVSLSDAVSLRDDLAIGLTDGKTGRSARHSDTRNPTDNKLIQGHIATLVKGNSAEAEAYFQSLVDPISSSLSAHKGTFFRGVPASKRDKIDGLRIGPRRKPKDGRYNSPGEKCIYLIDNPRFLSAELEGVLEMLVQRYNIPISELRIADLSVGNANLSNSLSLLLQMTERGTTSSGFDFESQLENKGRSRYALSQYVADSFKRRDWQGMYIPGVHGSPGDTYNNLVIFGACVDAWMTWTVNDYYEFNASTRDL